MTGIASDATEDNGSDSSDSEWHISTGIGSDAGESGSINFHLFNPASAANRAKFLTDGVWAHQADSTLRRYMFGGRTAGTIGTSAVDGIRFLFSGGNIESGTFTLYGRSN
jgi:hypothetical protein